MPRFSDSVFINCPFDKQYWPIFEGVIFCVIRCGFVPRCALEEADSGQVRLEMIQRIIRDSQYTIHDLSRIELGVESALPRFNMPFELGLDLGCRFYGTGKLKSKKCLILDAQPYRYQAFLSDIAGQDIQYHHNSPDRAITVVRNWLRTASEAQLPGPAQIKRQFLEFSAALPEYCDRNALDRNDLRFVDYVALAEEWLKADNT